MGKNLMEYAEFTIELLAARLKEWMSVKNETGNPSLNT